MRVTTLLCLFLLGCQSVPVRQPEAAQDAPMQTMREWEATHPGSRLILFHEGGVSIRGRQIMSTRELASAQWGDISLKLAAALRQIAGDETSCDVAITKTSRASSIVLSATRWACKRPKMKGWRLHLGQGRVQDDTPRFRSEQRLGLPPCLAKEVTKQMLYAKIVELEDGSYALTAAKRRLHAKPLGNKEALHSRLTQLLGDRPASGWSFRYYPHPKTDAYQAARDLTEIKAIVGRVGSCWHIRGPRTNTYAMFEGSLEELAPKSTPIGDFCDKSNIRAVVNSATKEIGTCYEQATHRGFHPNGMWRFKWNIELDGTTKNVSVEESPNVTEKEFESCVVGAIGKFRFQRPQGGICIINYPFSFLPPKPAK